MGYLVGVGAAALVCFVFGMWAGFDRERVFYPTVAVVVATYYLLFAVVGGSMSALAMEGVLAVAFAALAVAGFRKNLWLAVASLAGHGAMDSIHHLIIQNPGVPVWWPGFCLSFDVLAGVFLAILLIRRPGFAPPNFSPEKL